jgi:predicted ester cyclase
VRIPQTGETGPLSEIVDRHWNIGDITVTIVLIVADDVLVANRNRAHGIRKTDGKEMNWTEHEFWRVENDRLARQWSVADGLDIG